MTEELSFFKGCVWGIGLSIPIWVLVFAIAYLLHNVLS